MGDTDASVRFGIEFDLSGIKAGMEKAAANIKKSFTEPIKKEVSAAEKSIAAVLSDASKSQKAKAASIAAIYKKEGMDASAAFKKAWEQIERQTGSSTKKVKKSVKEIGSQAKETASSMGSAFSGSLKKLMSLAAAAFSVRAIINFGKECLELGSDLAEVQNVVDVTFPNMTARVDEFAQNAATCFGLSETMAKQFTGTFGAMAKAFGFTEQQAYDMSTTLTGLAGDVASFYNIDQEAAYTKLKSVFTGETESLKDLGVVMTQTALDSYALANGFGKTTAKMSEAEKVALRYAFVQDQLSAAAGDFARTSDSWANQVRILNLQFDSLKATIGQGLINLFTPVIRVVNTLIGKLMVLASAFKSFTEMVSGKKSSGMTADLNSTADAAGNAASAVDGIGDAAASSAKKIKGALAGFDELQTLNSTDSSGSGGGGMESGALDFGTIDTGALEEAESRTNAIYERWKELAELFKAGFFKGLGDTSVFDSIMLSARNIKYYLLDIFRDGSIAEAAQNCSGKVLESLGQISGAAVSVGASVLDNLFGGIERYLSGNTDRIREYFVSMFDLGGRIAELSGDLAGAIATVFESLRSDGAKSITESLTGMLSDTFMGATELAGKLAVDLMDTIAAPFINNSVQIRDALNDTFAAVAPVFESTGELVTEIFDTLNAVYDEHIGPMLQTFRDGLTEIGNKALELYETYIVPALEGMSGRFCEFKEQYLSPLIEKFGEFAGKVADAVTAVWQNVLQPLMENLMTVWAPVIADTLEAVWGFFMDMGEVIALVIDGVLTVLGGLLDFITGVFTGDWQLAWSGIRDFFSGIGDAMQAIAEKSFQAVWNTIKNVLQVISTYFKGKWDSMKQQLSDTLGGMWDKVSTVFNVIYGSVVGILNRLKTSWGDIWNGMKDTVISIFDSIWYVIRNTINSILGGVESMANGLVNGINGMISALNGIHVDIPEWVPGLGGKSFGISLPYVGGVSLPRLAEGAYVKPNTPQLAMIGDNLHQGEIVSPEDKIYEVSARAMRDVLQQFMTALTAMGSAQENGGTVVIRVTGEMAPLVRLLKLELDKEKSRTGIDFEVVYE